MSKECYQRVKERILASNESVSKGLDPDPWVVQFRLKQQVRSKRFRVVHAPKEKKKSPTLFKKGHIPPHAHKTAEAKLAAKIRNQYNSRAWQKANKDKINEWARIRRLNPSTKIKANLRKRLSTLLRISLVRKTEQTMELLGCTIKDFKDYLAPQFKEGMNFDNYGKWHLDHKIPCYYFDLTKLEDRQKCFHYTNIQPMWALDNLRKNKRMIATKVSFMFYSFH